jgi:hypothetical protein
MLNDTSLFTPTMAKVLESQGYFKEALQIYTHLLEEVPGHKGYQDKIAEIEGRLEGELERGDKLPVLFDEWLSLASEYRRLRQLKALRRSGKKAADEMVDRGDAK